MKLWVFYNDILEIKKKVFEDKSFLYFLFFKYKNLP